jgi:hypothetical protein
MLHIFSFGYGQAVFLVFSVHPVLYSEDIEELFKFLLYYQEI